MARTDTPRTLSEDVASNSGFPSLEPDLQLTKELTREVTEARAISRRLIAERLELVRKSAELIEASRRLRESRRGSSSNSSSSGNSNGAR